MVFDTAYYSNENLLICAPTGAGKTNIALLTVLRAINQHTDHDVIRKKDFKVSSLLPHHIIVYNWLIHFGIHKFTKRFALNETPDSALF